MNKNFVLAVLFSGMMFAGSTCVYSMQADPKPVTPPAPAVVLPVAQDPNTPAVKPTSTFSLETIFNSIKAKASDVATHVSTNKYKYGVAVSLLVAAALIYKTCIAQNDEDEEEAPTTMRSANYKATR
jgi:hypothetical protein